MTYRHSSVKNMKKYVLTSNIVEKYEYKGNNFKSSGGYNGRLLEENENTLKNYKSQTIHRRNQVRRLACANFNSNSKFITLTFDDKKVSHDIRDVKQCNNEFKKFIKRLKYHLKLDFIKYIAVIEFQDKNGRGAIHYHCLIDIPSISFLELQNIWGLGFIFIENISDVDNVGAYLVKYMTKETADIRLQKEKAYLVPKGLDKPIEFTDNDLKFFKKLHDKYIVPLHLENIEPVYTSTYDTDVLGNCKYTQYNLNKK